MYLLSNIIPKLYFSKLVVKKLKTGFSFTQMYFFRAVTSYFSTIKNIVQPYVLDIKGSGHI